MNLIIRELLIFKKCANTEFILNSCFRDWDLQLERSWLAPVIEQSLDELLARGLELQPHFWVADEWFVPDGVPGAAIPFYLLHKDLLQVEMISDREPEGTTPKQALKLIRHELGHVVDNAFKLRNCHQRKALFGDPRTPYPEEYFPSLYSKNFVRHLPMGYAQSHPDEDFAETFAVWLDPESQWRHRYRGWKAFRKLQYMDELMKSLRYRTPYVKTEGRPGNLEGSRKTLKSFYLERQEMTSKKSFRPLLGEISRPLKNTKSSSQRLDQFLKKEKRRLSHVVGEKTGCKIYEIEALIGNVIIQCERTPRVLKQPPACARRRLVSVLSKKAPYWLEHRHHFITM